MERIQEVEVEISVNGINVRGEVEVQVESTFRCRARRLYWRRVEGIIQHMLDDGLAGAAQVTIGRRRANPVQEAAQEAQLLDDTGACDSSDRCVLKGRLEEFVAENSTGGCCEGHDLFVGSHLSAST